MTRKCSKLIWSAITSVVAILGLFVLGVTPAVAGVGGSDTPTWPPSAAVGQTFAANVFVTNTSTSPNDVESVNLISLFVTPACADSADNPCAAINADPGTFKIVSAVGNVGTAPCSGVAFTIGPENVTTGEVQLTPTSTVTLAPTNPAGGNVSCLVDLQILVLKVPSNPVPPVPPAPPFTTDVLTRVALVGVTSGLGGSGAGSAQIDVNKGVVTISTTSNPNTTNVVPGTSVSDSVTVTGPAGAVTPTGNVRFILCQPGEVNPGVGCSSPAGTKVGSDKALVAGAAASDSTSDTTAIGQYCWRARYLGDANYDVQNHTNATTECFTTEAIVISEVCKTPGYFGNHTTVTQAGIDALTLKIGTPLTICGQDITNVSVPDPASAIEAICAKPSTDKTEPLKAGRNLMAAALNCVANNPTPAPGATVCEGVSINDLFEACNAECATVASQGGRQVIVTINGVQINCNPALDCYNNGLGFDPTTGACSAQQVCMHENSLVGTCSQSGTICSNNVPCPQGETCDHTPADPTSCTEALGNTCTIFSGAC